MPYSSPGEPKTAVTTGSTTYPQWGLSWTYDRFGNRWAQTLVAGSGFGGTNSFDYAGNRVTTTNFTYDNSGNLTANGRGLASPSMRRTS